MKPLNNKKRLGIEHLLIILPFCICLIILPFLFKKSLFLFPSIKKELSLESYLDTLGSEKQGGTVITHFDTNQTSIDLQYIIGNRNIYPFAGFQWIVKPNNPWIDLRGYDNCTISIDPATTENVLILILQFYIDGFSKMNDRMTWRSVIKELPLTKGQTTYTVSLNEFATPLWWYNQYKKTEKEFSPLDYSKLGMVSLEEGSDDIGVPKRICLRSLKFDRKQGYYIAEILFFTLIIYYILFFAIVQVRKLLNRKSSPIVIPYQKLTITDNQKTDEVNIFEYLGNNFSNPDLSLSFMSTAIGIPGNKISSIVKNRYNLTFRQYLNTIRIAEAKRLLQETDLQISQIAYKVGYSNLTHFCRTFKDETQASPNSFRHDQPESLTVS
jgi:AraC-like DNA-binding protein